MTVSAAPRSGRFPTLAKYDVLDELGHGGMATVYRARDRRLGRDVAVKVIHPHLRDSREIAHRFAVEAKAVAKLRHPNIVEVFDVSSEDEPEQYLVVELLRGLTLRKLLQVNGAIPPEVAAVIGVELLGAVAHAHSAGVVHRDIKPENVMIEHRAVPNMGPDAGVSGVGRASPADQPGDRALVKLTDFGIAKLLDGNGMTSTGQVLGSPAHMAPEQIEGAEVDGRADIFGIGVLLYECMVGHLPFEGNNPAQVLRRVLEGSYPSAERERPSVGKTWSALLDRALAHKPEDRYPDAATMREALQVELRRLGVVSPRSELESWCDDPEGFGAQHTKRMIPVLCDLAGAARKRGDALSSAADYNRALAYAPDDPALLRIVTSLHRSENSRRLAKRIAPIVAGAIALGALAFFVTRALRAHPATDPTPKPPVSVATGPTASAPLLVASAGAGGATGVDAGQVKPPPTTLVISPTTTARSMNPPKVATRDVVLTRINPPRALVSVDEAPPVDVEAGRTFTFDVSPHSLVFSCPKDLEGNSLCEPRTVRVPPGPVAPDPLIIRLNIKDAFLQVEGDPNKHYVIKEDSKHVIVGEDTPVKMVESASRIVHVTELETDRNQTVQLRAGKHATASFLGP